jgi:hypothetical protein
MSAAVRPHGLQAHVLISPSSAGLRGFAELQARPLPVSGSRVFARTLGSNAPRQATIGLDFRCSTGTGDPHEKVTKGVDHRRFHSPGGHGCDRRRSNRGAEWWHIAKYNRTVFHLPGRHPATRHTAEQRSAKHGSAEHDSAEHDSAEHSRAEHCRAKHCRAKHCRTEHSRAEHIDRYEWRARPSQRSQLKHVCG